VLISIDTLSRSALSSFDSSATARPALDALARESVRFTRAYSTAAWTLPAHASLLTGLYPDRHGATTFDVGIEPSAPTLAERLRAAGYETVAFTNGGLVSDWFGLGRGFERYDERVEPGAASAAIDLPRDGRSVDIPGMRLFERVKRRSPEYFRSEGLNPPC
jgi:arylsulfatase A-like enzyme